MKEPADSSQSSSSSIFEDQNLFIRSQTILQLCDNILKSSQSLRESIMQDSIHKKKKVESHFIDSKQGDFDQIFDLPIFQDKSFEVSEFDECSNLKYELEKIIQDLEQKFQTQKKEYKKILQNQELLRSQSLKFLQNSIDFTNKIHDTQVNQSKEKQLMQTDPLTFLEIIRF